MAIKTTLVQLEEVQAAISKVMSGQSGAWDGKQLTMADLSQLTAREKYLKSVYASEQGTSITVNRGRIGRG